VRNKGGANLFEKPLAESTTCGGKTGNYKQINIPGPAQLIDLTLPILKYQKATISMRQCSRFREIKWGPNGRIIRECCAPTRPTILFCPFSAARQICVRADLPGLQVLGLTTFKGNRGFVTPPNPSSAPPRVVFDHTLTPNISLLLPRSYSQWPTRVVFGLKNILDLSILIPEGQKLTISFSKPDLVALLSL